MDQVITKFERPEYQHRHPPVQSDPSSPPVPAVNDMSKSNLDSSQQPSQRWQVVMDPPAGPASCVSEVRPTASLTHNSAPRHPDLITTGIISLQQALSLFDIYHQRLDHFLYKILGELTSLDSVRRCSPLLTAAVCTVGALHAQSLGHLFDVCYREYKALASAYTFSSTLNVDDIRGLCIGAFWLHELSWVLIGMGRSILVGFHYIC